jgi:hypothetical protein
MQNVLSNKSPFISVQNLWQYVFQYGYSIGRYWWLLMVIILMIIGGYSIGRYW